ncbi:hypothetical protein FHS82_001033 [Pseudochelatococcus lubricantis]|uniref:Uncharacterized protein n=1 Tax=Pseudochelatococcus lubricantis TaxID=1538102 RepID=A0ABX0UWR8_9HYPH|nr:hypothetical protein [Pseudochelatococcus lubricantis]NIJ57207.1 hypothetical protein [Pseudochelatococcus lubricantis]
MSMLTSLRPSSLSSTSVALNEAGWLSVNATRRLPSSSVVNVMLPANAPSDIIDSVFQREGNSQHQNSAGQNATCAAMAYGAASSIRMFRDMAASRVGP